MAETKVEKVHKTEAEWRELLTPEQFHVMREGRDRACFYWGAGQQSRGRNLPLRGVQCAAIYLG